MWNEFGVLIPQSSVPHEEWVMSTRLLVLGLIVLQTLDLILTNLLLSGYLRADVYEANPLARWILTTGGWAGLATFKAGCTAIAILAALLVTHWRPATGHRLLVLMCVLMFGVVSYSSVLAAQATDPEFQIESLTQANDDLDKAQQSFQTYLEMRNTLCIALLRGEVSLLQAVLSHQDLLDEYSSNFVGAYRDRLPKRYDISAQTTHLLHLSARLIEEKPELTPLRLRLQQLQTEGLRLNERNTGV